ncbi:MAG: hypothetical protein IH986_17770 [Planctomycetes bacterium]|nr:hypothetical protein [Planctomycetota bacterium]
MKSIATRAALLAALLASLPASAQSNDNCEDAQSIVGAGTFTFDNSGAGDTLFGIRSTQIGCPVEKDVWFRWAAPCDAEVLVSTCGSTDVDTTVAVYDTTDCPPPLAAAIGCNDDSCGLQSQVVFTAAAGQEYLIRIGSYPTRPGGTGSFTITCDPRPPNDECENAERIECNTTLLVNNAAAAPLSSLQLPSCTRGGRRLAGALWYEFVATDTSATISTCGLDSGDTLLALYEGDCGNLVELACADDTCGAQAEISVENLSVGATYLVQFRTYDLSQGTHALRVSCPRLSDPPDPVCQQVVENCRPPDRSSASNSDRTNYRTADDFTVAVDGSISQVCWWGGYYDGNGDCAGAEPDSFEIRYFVDDNGLPGALLAEFSQELGTLNLSGPVWTREWISAAVREREYSGTHAPVPVTRGTCYWVEISNQLTNCSWFWQAGVPGNQRGMQDGAPLDGYDLEDATDADHAFCLNLELADSTPCLPPPPAPNCAQPPENCQAGGLLFGGIVSDASSFIVADDFVLVRSGDVSEICWTGAYLDAGCPGSTFDEFEVRYYADLDGQPAALIGGPFSQTAGTLIVTGRLATGRRLAGAFPEFEYTASHGGVFLQAGRRYWIEITNPLSGCGWLWEYAALGEGNGVAMVDGPLPDGYTRADIHYDDFAFCLNLELADSILIGPPPANDDCANAIGIPANGSLTVDNTFATNDPSDPLLSCSHRGGVGTVWARFLATHTSALIRTTTKATGDTVIGVYAGTCGNLVEIGCNDDAGGLRSEICLDALTVGEIYYIQFATFADFDRGIHDVTITSPCPGPPPNEDCADAFGPLELPAVVLGSTVGAEPDYEAPDCDGVLITSPGVWYHVKGTGTELRASLCTEPTDFDTRLSVYTGSCVDLVCVAADDDGCDTRSRLAWASVANEDYYILVHSRGGATGTFELNVSNIPAGDMNCDGGFDGADVDPFFLALGDPAAYRAAFPDCNLLNGDLNCDRTLNGADIDPFFDCLAGINCDDCNANGIPDQQDVAQGTSSDCNDNGAPDECEADCNDKQSHTS